MAATFFGLPAVGQASPPSGPIILGSSGTIIDKGAAAVVPVQVACPPGDQAFISLQLNEKSGNGVAQGYSNPVTVNCTGGIQNVDITVPATSKPFTNGTAFGQATMYDFYFGQSSSTNNVRLSK